MSAHAHTPQDIYNQLLPYLIVLAGVIIGLYVYFYLTNVESSVQQSLTSNTSPQSAAVAIDSLEQEAASEIEPEEEIVTDKSLQKIIDDFAKKQFATTGIFVKQLDSNSTAGVNQTTTFKSASLYKLFVAYETLLQVDEEKLSLAQATGYDAGGTSIAQCLDSMISVSDNPCGRALRRVIDVTEKPIPRLAELGFTGTNLAYDYPTTSPADVGLLFEKLYTQADLSEESNQLFLTHLKNQKINDRLPQGLPSGTEIAHKTADLEGFTHDGGIIYHHGGDYILVIMGGPWQSDLSTVYSNYASLTAEIHEHLTGDAP